MELSIFYDSNDLDGLDVGEDEVCECQVGAVPNALHACFTARATALWGSC